MDRAKATVAARHRRWGSGAALVAMVAAGFGLGGAASALPGPTEKVSVSSTGTPASGDSEGAPALSSDGRYVAFASHADNLVPGKAVHGLNVYVRDRVAGTTELVSQSSDGTPANNNASVAPARRSAPTAATWPSSPMPTTLYSATPTG